MSTEFDRDQLAKDLESEMNKVGGADKVFDAESVIDLAEKAESAEQPEPSEPEEVEGEGTDAAPEKKPGALIATAKKLGYDVDDETSDDEIAEALFKQLAKLEAARKEAEQKALEVARKAEEAPVKKAEEPKAAEPPKPEPKQKKFGKLARPDAALNALVEWDEETGQFIGKERYGTAAVEAAKQFNDYRMERRRREEAIIDDPSALTDDIRMELAADFEARLEAKLQERLSQLEQKQMQTVQQTAAEQEQTQFYSFMESVKDKLYKLGPDGQPKKTLDNEPAWTEAGKAFRDEYAELLEINPNANPLLLAKKAYRIVEKMTAAAPAKSPADEAKDKRKAFVSKGRKHDSGVPSAGSKATVQDKFNSGNNVRLWEALLEDTENEDNPELAPYRK